MHGGELQRGRGRPRRAFAPPLANNYMTPGLGPTFPFPVPGGGGGGGAGRYSVLSKSWGGVPRGGQKSFQIAYKNKHLALFAQPPRPVPPSPRLSTLVKTNGLLAVVHFAAPTFYHWW